MIISNVKGLTNFLAIVLLILCTYGCIEPIEIETKTYESALVIEGTLTNESSHQEILLSRTYELEENEASKETNAQVQVLDNSNVYDFEEVEPGRYVSVEPFQAVSGKAYILEVTTSDGNKYSSEPEQLPQTPGLLDLHAERISYGNEDGVAVFVNVDGAGEKSAYYLFEFEETFKIVSPFDFDRDLVYRNGQFVEVPKTREEEICYVTEPSEEILLANTNSQSSNDLNEFLVRFIDGENYRTAHRYSILVRQYSISVDAFSYYETLKDFSDSESIFSETQLGHINGNLNSLSDPNEKVIGFFSVAEVNAQRLFFDFEEFYSRKEFIPDSHISLCEVLAPPINTEAEIRALKDQIERGSVKYIGMEVDQHLFVRARCVDCTFFGTNVPPDFWEE
jgi:hypothetical protein